MSPAFAGMLTGDGWSPDTDDPTDIGFISDTGTRIRRHQLRGLALTFCAACELDLEKNAVALADGEIDADEWRETAQQIASDEAIILGALGAGGLSEVADEDWETIAGRVTTDEMPGNGIDDMLQRLDRFEQQVMAPEAKGEAESQAEAEPTPKTVALAEQPEDEGESSEPDESAGEMIGSAGTRGQVVSRAGMYGRQYGVFEQVRRNATARLAQRLNLQLEEMNVLCEVPGVRHCLSAGFTLGCIECTDAGYQPIGTLPPPGERTCAGGCLCSFVYRIAPGAKGE